MKKFAFVLPLLFILGLSYWRYTYILNPNLDGDPFMIEISKLGWTISSNSYVNIKSILIYWLFFFLGNVALFLTLYKTLENAKIIGFFYLLLSIISALFFTVEMFWFKSSSIFNLAAILKNFLLSPMFTTIAYIVIEYFHWFGKSS